LGYVAFHTGDIRQARSVFEEAWEGFLHRPPEGMVSPFWGMPHDPVTITAAALTCLAGLEGRVADSETWRRRAVERAEGIGFPQGPFSLALLTLYLARAHAWLGNGPQALQTVDDALLLVQKQGEWIHQPDLLRLRAELTATVRPGRMDDVVDDLRAAVEVGLAQGSLVLALRAAIDLARVSAGTRPADWRSVLSSVYDVLPPGSEYPGVLDAR